MTCNSSCGSCTASSSCVTSALAEKKICISADIIIPKTVVSGDIQLGTKGAKGEDGVNGADGSVVILTAGSAILSYTPVAVIEGEVFTYDAGNADHLFAFSGFSITAAAAGDDVSIQLEGFCHWSGFSVLTAGSHYMAGAAGSLVQTITSELFSRVVAYVSSAGSIKIINQTPIITNN